MTISFELMKFLKDTKSLNKFSFATFVLLNNSIGQLLSYFIGPSPLR